MAHGPVKPSVVAAWRPLWLSGIIAASQRHLIKPFLANLFTRQIAYFHIAAPE
jgi:hypothetical protein